MLYSRSYKQQIKILAPLLVIFLGMAAAVLFVIGLLRVTAGVDIGELTRDPIHKTGLHPFVGFLSNLGVMLWAFTAATCFFTAMVMRRSGRGGKEVGFFLAAGAITTWLMLDDMYLFHEVIFRDYLGIGESITYPLYVGMAALFVYRFRLRIMNSEYILLVLAACFFLVSMVFDLFADSELLPGSYLFEDGFKFLGIVSWLLYFTRSGFAEVMGARQAGRSRMVDGSCSRCGSSSISIVTGKRSVEVPFVPLSAVHRYERPKVSPLKTGHLLIRCDDCHYSEFYFNERMKLVSVDDDRRRAG